MTAYEIADLFTSMIDSSATIIINYISVLFAFLVVAYLIAPYLNRVMSGIVIGLFTVFSAMMILSINRNLVATTNLADEMRKKVLDGETALAWHPVISEPANFTELSIPIIMSLLIASSIGGIVFFIYASKRKLGDGFKPLGL